MAQDASQLVVGANGQVYVGDAGETLPSSATDTPGGSFTELGFVSEDGFTLTDGKNVEDIRALQSFYPLRRIITARSFELAFELEQWNEDTVGFAFGGGTFAGDIYSPPDPSTLDERAIVIAWQDGDNSFMVMAPKGVVTEDVETKIARNAAAILPITFSVTPEGDDDPWNIIMEIASS